MNKSGSDCTDYGMQANFDKVQMADKIYNTGKYKQK